MDTNTTPETRIFNFNGRVLEDPDPSMPPEKVLEFYATLHAELNNAKLKGPSIGADGKKSYKVEVQIGSHN